MKPKNQTIGRNLKLILLPLLTEKKTIAVLFDGNQKFRKPMLRKFPYQLSFVKL
jgi:hypothetical protein